MSPKKEAAAATSTDTSDERAPLLGRPTPPAADGSSSGPAAWLSPRGSNNDENLAIFRRALGINSDLTTPAAGYNEGRSLEEGRKAATGTYRAVLRSTRRRHVQTLLMSILVWTAHVTQVILGAVLTALGPSARQHARAITVLGAVNTVVAGLLALIKGRGWPDRLRRDELAFRRCLDFIEETERLVAVGVAGRDREEVGGLVETAFGMWDAARASESDTSGSGNASVPGGVRGFGERVLSGFRRRTERKGSVEDGR